MMELIRESTLVSKEVVKVSVPTELLLQLLATVINDLPPRHEIKMMGASTTPGCAIDIAWERPPLTQAMCDLLEVKSKQRSPSREQALQSTEIAPAENPAPPKLDSLGRKAAPGRTGTALAEAREAAANRRAEIIKLWQLEPNMHVTTGYWAKLMKMDDTMAWRDMQALLKAGLVTYDPEYGRYALVVKPTGTTDAAQPAKPAKKAGRAAENVEIARKRRNALVDTLQKHAVTISRNSAWLLNTLQSRGHYLPKDYTDVGSIIRKDLGILLKQGKVTQDNTFAYKYVEQQPARIAGTAS